MKRYTKRLLSIIMFVMPITLSCQVTVNDALVTSGENMKLKMGLFTSGIPRKITFGPYRITDIRKGKSHLIGQHRDAFLEIKGKGAGMKRGVVTTKSQPFSLIIMQEGADTIVSNIDLTTVKGDHALIEMSSGKGTKEESITSYCEDIQVQIKTDSLNWHMPSSDDQHTDYKDYPLQFNRVLTNGVDNITVTGADGFLVKRKSFENHTKAIAFIYKKKQVAALETYPESSIWFSNDITENHKKVIVAVIMSLLSTSQVIIR